MKCPLVSIGLPTYKNPDGLARAVQSLLLQTYENIEIIISDNTPFKDVDSEFINKITDLDGRIYYYNQKENIGAYQNFKYVLTKSSAEYFMWAADDDLWAPFFIEKCMSQLLSDQSGNIVAVGMEAQYFNSNAYFPIFSEGEHFYNLDIKSPCKRVVDMLYHNYGNLWYSVFRKEVLLINHKRNVLSQIESPSSNEIFLFLYVASKGNWRILRDIGFYKQAPHHVYEQASWEMNGGKLPNRPHIRKHLRGIKGMVLYHRKAFKDIVQSLQAIDVSCLCKFRIYLAVLFVLSRHVIYLIFGRKPKFKSEK